MLNLYVPLLTFNRGNWGFICYACLVVGYGMFNFWEPLYEERHQLPSQARYHLILGCLGMPVAIEVD